MCVRLSYFYINYTDDAKSNLFTFLLLAVYDHLTQLLVDDFTRSIYFCLVVRYQCDREMGKSFSNLRPLIMQLIADAFFRLKLLLKLSLKESNSNSVK